MWITWLRFRPEIRSDWLSFQLESTAYNEFVRKPAAFVGYGGVGAARAVEQLRLILAEMQVAGLKHAVHISGSEFLGMLREGKDFSDYPYLADTVAPMLDHLVWWARTLKAGREGSGA